MTISLNLAVHELGHAVAQAIDGCGFSVVSETESGAMCTAIVRDGANLTTPVSSPSTIVAGSAFTTILDSRCAELEPENTFAVGAGIMQICEMIGVAESDAAEFRALSEADRTACHGFARRWMLTAHWGRELWLSIADEISKRPAPILLSGVGLRDLLAGAYAHPKLAMMPGRVALPACLELTKAPSCNPADLFLTEGSLLP